LLAVRRELRAAARYPQADAIRAALTSAGIEVHDVDGATTWTRTAARLA